MNDAVYMVFDFVIMVLTFTSVLTFCLLVVAVIFSAGRR